VARTAQDALRASAGDLVFFSDASAELGARARRVLEGQVAWMQGEPGARVVIEGHADDSGSAGDNLKLSEARAKAVLDRLVESGIDASRLSIAAAGTTKKVAACGDQSCAPQNRRAATMVVLESVAAAAPPARAGSSRAPLPLAR
jgi:peptidoglycan-associated lipoprotein